jgi:Na+/glutamate symporter
MYAWVNSNFAELHRDYTRRISVIVVPLMLAQAFLSLRQVIIAPELVSVMQAVLIASVWSVTTFISVPLHRRLSAGYDARVINRLINTNWLRTAGWSLVSLLDWLK